MRLPDPLRSRAVLIGASHYRDAGLPDLPAVANNLTDFAAILTDPGLGGLPRDHCRVLPRPRLPHQIGVSLAELAAQAEDTLLVYYAGHGLLAGDGELYLALNNTQPGFLAYTALPFRSVRRALLDSPAVARVLVLDCCFSGRAIEAMADPAGLIAGQVGITGAFTLTSTAANVPAHAPSGARNTAFTGDLVKILRDGASEGPELLSLSDIYLHLLRAAAASGRPRPQQGGTATAPMLALVPNKAFVPAPAPPEAPVRLESASSPTVSGASGGNTPPRLGRKWITKAIAAVIAVGTVGAIIATPSDQFIPRRPRPNPSPPIVWTAVAGSNCPQLSDRSASVDPKPDTPQWQTVPNGGWTGDGCSGAYLSVTTTTMPAPTATFTWIFHPHGNQCMVEVYVPNLTINNVTHGGDVAYRIGQDTTSPDPEYVAVIMKTRPSTPIRT